jgi:hypothetical protein
MHHRGELRPTCQHLAPANQISEDQQAVVAFLFAAPDRGLTARLQLLEYRVL